MVEKRDPLEGENNKYKWPKIDWKINFWINLLPGILGFVLYIWPQLQTEPSLDRIRRIIGFVLLFFPVFSTLLVWAFKSSIILIRRTRDFIKILDEKKTIEQEDEKFRAITSEKILQLLILNSFEVREINYDNGLIYVEIMNNAETNFDVDNEIILFDSEYDQIIGFFRITSVRKDHCIAVGLQGLEPMWAGDVKSKGHIHFVPNIYAYLISEGSNYDA